MIYYWAWETRLELCAAACVCDDRQIEYTNICCSPVQEVQLKRLLFTGKTTTERSTHLRWPCVRCDSHLSLELTSPVCLELVDDPQYSRMATARGLCRHLGNNHRILSRGWITSHWCVSSGISSLLYLLLRVRTTVSNSWSNHSSHVPVPHPPTHLHSVLLPPLWSSIPRCSRTPVDRSVLISVAVQYHSWTPRQLTVCSQISWSPSFLTAKHSRVFCWWNTPAYQGKSLLRPDFVKGYSQEKGHSVHCLLWVTCEFLDSTFGSVNYSDLP